MKRRVRIKNSGTIPACCAKVNSRVEKEFDKTDRAFDTRDACEQSYNVNAYWEANTLRCLDRRTGRPVTP